MNIQGRLINYFGAGYPGIAIQTAEERRAVADVITAAKACKRDVVTWSATEGLRQILPDARDIPGTTEDLIPALAARGENTVYIFRDAQTWPFDRDPLLSRGLRDMLDWAPTAGSCVVLIGPTFKPHQTVEKLVTVLDYSLPSDEDVRRIAEGIAESSREAQRKRAEEGLPVNTPPDLTVTDDAVRAASGLTTVEIENALALALREAKRFDPAIIYREKVLAVKRTGLLEVISPDPAGLAGIGGLDELKGWILKRKRAYTLEAAKYGLPAPKGVLLVGVPGTGKSLAAKAVGTALGVPTVRLDIGSLFGSLVGESEAQARDALALAEAMAPCVLWIDEIDKGLAGSSGSGDNDSGTTRRVFGTIISWMQERRRPVFLVATANQVQALPPELLRKGRFDEIFAVDLPNEDERTAILGLHLSRRGREKLAKDKIDLARVVAVTQDFTGSELEAVIEAAMFEAFDLNREVSVEDLIGAAKATVPLAQTAKEQIVAIREWAKTRARFASRSAKKTAPGDAARRVMT